MSLFFKRYYKYLLERRLARAELNSELVPAKPNSDGSPLSPFNSRWCCKAAKRATCCAWAKWTPGELRRLLCRLPAPPIILKKLSAENLTQKPPPPPLLSILCVQLLGRKICCLCSKIITTTSLDCAVKRYCYLNCPVASLTTNKGLGRGGALGSLCFLSLSLYFAAYLATASSSSRRCLNLKWFAFYYSDSSSDSIQSPFILVCVSRVFLCLDLLLFLNLSVFLSRGFAKWSEREAAREKDKVFFVLF